VIKTEKQYRRYEKERFRFRKPDPVEAILFRMEEQGKG
jgi:antitoxin component HigA of HigAB toxin-antitoxin module